VVKGSHTDLDIIREEASKADVILNAADADDLDLTKAILAGAKSTKTGKTPILIHTSGTALASKEPTGTFDPTAKVYNVRWMVGKLSRALTPSQDNEVNDIRSIPAEAPHRNIDLEYGLSSNSRRILMFKSRIFEADSAGYVSAYIIAPSTIYGTGSGPVNRISQQIPAVIKLQLAHKQVVYAGDGTNKWNNVRLHSSLSRCLGSPHPVGSH